MENKTNTYTWTIIDKQQETSEVFTLVLEAIGEQPSFIAGQYLTVRLKDHEPLEGKCYSISSSPLDTRIVLTIKLLGKFSRALLAHSVGDTLTTSAPYGFFYPEEPFPAHLIFIAGGVGIAPIFSIIRTLCVNQNHPRMTLLYSNKTRDNIIFNEKLNAFAHPHSKLHIHHFITQEKVAESEFMHNGRISQEFLSTLPQGDANIFICGSIDFTKTIWTYEKEIGIPQNKIYTEAFF